MPISFLRTAGEKKWSIQKVPDVGQLHIDFQELMESLEDELSRSRGEARTLQQRERAVLVGVSAGPVWQIKESLEELRDLAISSVWRSGMLWFSAQAGGRPVPDRKGQTERAGVTMPSDRIDGPHFRS